MQMKPLDATFPIQKQLGGHASPVVLVNLFTLDREDEAAFLAAWTKDAVFMKAQSGFISTQLHRAVGPSATFLNTAVWESVEAFGVAFSAPEFQAKLADYPASAETSPHLFQTVAVPGVCVA